VRAFQVGVAALDSGVRPEIALPKLNRAIELIPAEPAGWVNRGLYHLRNNNLKEAEQDLRQAKRLAPDSAEIDTLLGLLAKRQGKLPEAIVHLRKAVEKSPNDLGSLFALAQTLGLEGGAESDAEQQQLLERILSLQPNNLSALMKCAIVAHRRQDQAALKRTLARLDQLAPQWSKVGAADPRVELAELHQAVAKAPGEVEFCLIRLGNVLQSQRGYARGSEVLKAADDARIGTSMQHFLRLAPPRPTPAPPDRGLAFTVAPWPGAPAALAKSRWDTLGILWRIGAARHQELVQAATDGGMKPPPAQTFQPVALLANSREMRPADANAATLAFPGGRNDVVPSPAGVLVIDWNNDLRADLLLTGAGGLRFWQQSPDGVFVEVTAKTGLSDDVLGGDYYGAWAADVEMDGDLDIIVARRSGPPLLLRNNGDGTFKAIEKTFAGVENVRDFVWVDLDNDGAADAVFLDASGKLHVFANERSMQFTPWPLAGPAETVLAVTAADINDDGVFDLVALVSNGTLLRISDQHDHRTAWQTAELASGITLANAAVGTVKLFAEDMDNNGTLDVIVAGPDVAHVLLADAEFRFQALLTTVPMRTFGVLDLDGDGRLDLVGLSSAGAPVWAKNTGEKTYHAQTLRPVANPKEVGDRRVNSFGIGGDIEVRSGLLVQKQRITGPNLHIGLGEQTSIDVTRIVWPSGFAQFEFEPPTDPIVIAAQRLFGSCPFLFTFDGTGMRFVGDTLWNTPLGMFVNGQNVDSFRQTTEWLKIRGEHLLPKNGYYDVRVHANLWETDYFDQLALLVVDHPPDTEIYADERFFLEPTRPNLYVTAPARPVARAWDHRGQDVTEIVAKVDGRYLDRAGRGNYQGITADHWVEADLGDDAPTDGPLYLVARGWTHPTDSSINVAISQGKHVQPQPLVLEVPDGKGGWKMGRPALGFPAGKDKTILIRLDGIDGPAVSRRFRLRTNLEIYWDFLGYARGLDSKLAKTERPAMKSAELQYRGILEMTQKDASSPEVPHYDKVMRGRQMWRDLTGYYTRYGDVSELLAKVDDRYVIMNAGDEIALQFAAPADPPSGWRRDFIWECDGWTRDGNQNTRFGTTVLPLPAHGLKSLDRPPGLLTDDPVYRRSPQDWVNYHTRYVTPGDFERGLRR
jgi:tetratricopeptide (TPR) repeat protein